ncbi:hypothetical protein H6P81_015106 [Aristolochia fimbriata]|uniref:Uncharacterized protein n=1 Tax=Aristolochia fimbriata TaxID=158543 RepID=A0AAV7E5S8_ARIFI|nr:hypothetical protein H6P81_015106 [Aristolochia fimbriata]
MRSEGRKIKRWIDRWSCRKRCEKSKRDRLIEGARKILPLPVCKQPRGRVAQQSVYLLALSDLTEVQKLGWDPSDMIPRDLGGLKSRDRAFRGGTWANRTAVCFYIQTHI